jgi:hypothetical protein
VCDPDVDEDVLLKWTRQQTADTKGAFPGEDGMNPEQQKIERVGRLRFDMRGGMVSVFLIALSSCCIVLIILQIYSEAFLQGQLLGCIVAKRVLEIAPKAGLLIESLRDIGYSLETALSDIIDNSIAAGADTIEILVDPSAASPQIAIRDNGCGMSEEELLDAMRAGSRSPLAERTGPDLGRFGLGMKTASFSQCRRLTVISRKAGQLSVAAWDLDHVAATDRWEVEVPDDPCSLNHAEELVGDGTMVLWETLDRVIGDATGATAHAVLARRISEAQDHLELVFHRFLVSEPGSRKIAIFLNNQQLKPRDPFATKHPATQRDPEEIRIVKDHRVAIQTFTLPHHTKMNPKEHDALGGAGGFLKNQGFYLYRERRLIIWGTWFGLARPRPITQLTRVRIDMPRDLDADWKIDVKKASAQPPAALREYLRGLVDRICAGSKRVYTHKGRKTSADDRLEVWSRVQDKGEIRYRLNPDHPVLASLHDELSDAGRSRLRALVALVESSLPVDSIFADKGGDPKSVVMGALDENGLGVLAAETYRMLNDGSPEHSVKALEMMRVLEPFASSWTVVKRALATEFAWSQT